MCDLVYNKVYFPCANLPLSDDFMVVDNVAFEFSTTLASLVSMNTFRLEDDDCLEEDEVLQGTFEIPSIIGRQLSAMARDPEITYIIIQDDDSECGCVVMVTVPMYSFVDPAQL